MRAVAGERRLRILTKLAGDTAPELQTRRLCDVCREVTGVSGAGIMLMSDEIPRGAVCTTGEVSALVERLQLEVGEGPCVDAYHQGRPVLEPDLAAALTPRWLAFAGPAVEAGVRAIFGFPLQVGAVRLGALNLYCDRPGPLTDDQHADALVMADVAAQAVIAMQAGTRPGRLAKELEAGADFQYVVHQASGMVAAQLDVSVGQALIRLRGYAFGNDRPLVAVAEDVVARALRFDDRSGEQDPAP
jgi:GAF domain-containing protein